MPHVSPSPARSTMSGQSSVLNAEEEDITVHRVGNESLGMEVRGMVVTRLLCGGPAWNAGVTLGMRVLRVDGEQVSSVRVLSSLVQAAGGRIVLTVSVPPGPPVERGSPSPIRHRDRDDAAAGAFHSLGERRHYYEHDTRYAAPQRSPSRGRSQVARAEHDARHAAQRSPSRRRGGSQTARSQAMRATSPEVLDSFHRCHGDDAASEAAAASSTPRPGRRQLSQTPSQTPQRERSTGRRRVPSVAAAEHSEGVRTMMTGEDTPRAYIRFRRHAAGPVDELLQEEPTFRKPAPRANMTSGELGLDGEGEGGAAAPKTSRRRRPVPEDTWYSPTRTEAAQADNKYASISRSPKPRSAVRDAGGRDMEDVFDWRAGEEDAAAARHASQHGGGGGGGDDDESWPPPAPQPRPRGRGRSRSPAATVSREMALAFEWREEPHPSVGRSNREEYLPSPRGLR